jgi:hypothetical protein
VRIAADDGDSGYPAAVRGHASVGIKLFLAEALTERADGDGGREVGARFRQGLIRCALVGGFSYPSCSCELTRLSQRQRGTGRLRGFLYFAGLTQCRFMADNQN